MLRTTFFIALLTTTLAAGAAPAADSPQTATEVSFAIVRTARLPVKEALVFSGGRLLKDVDTNFSAFVIRHGDSLLLFDTGLGREVAAQYRQDMPWWQRPFFRYDDPVSPASAQLRLGGITAVPRIILSHSHWDHASAIADFPDAEVWAAEEELAVIRHPGAGVGGAWPSQVAAPSIRWHALRFQPVACEGFDRSLDLFGDGSVVLVPMPGHTPGSVGMFLTVTSGRRYFFVGDVVWNAGALAQGAPKFWPARMLVDADAPRTQDAIEAIRRVMQRHPDMTIVPAHDGGVQDRLGYFPSWIQ